MANNDHEDGVFVGLRRLEVSHVLSIEEKNATGNKMVHGSLDTRAIN